MKKALIVVSGCLQDNPRPDPCNYLPGKLMGSSSTAHPERFPQRSYSSGHHPSDYHSRGFSSHLGVDLHSSGQRKYLEEDMLFRMLCTNDKVGCIIGKGGSIIRALQLDTGASIKVVDAIPDSEERVIAISSREVNYFTFYLGIQEISLACFEYSSMQKKWRLLPVYPNTLFVHDCIDVQ